MFTLRQPKSGLPVEDISRKVAICQAVFFRCKIKYAAIGIEEIKCQQAHGKTLIPDLFAAEGVSEDG